MPRGGSGGCGAPPLATTGPGGSGGPPARAGAAAAPERIGRREIRDDGVQIGRADLEQRTHLPLPFLDDGANRVRVDPRCHADERRHARQRAAHVRTVARLAVLPERGLTAREHVARHRRLRLRCQPLPAGDPSRVFTSSSLSSAT